MKTIKNIFIVLICLTSNIFAGGALSTHKGSASIEKLLKDAQLAKARYLIPRLTLAINSLITRDDIKKYLEELPHNSIIKTKIDKIKYCLLGLDKQDICSKDIDLHSLYNIELLIGVFEGLSLNDVSYADAKKLIHLIELNLDICPDNELTLKEFAHKNYNVFYLVCAGCFCLNVVAAIYNILEVTNYQH